MHPFRPYTVLFSKLRNTVQIIWNSITFWRDILRFNFSCIHLDHTCQTKTQTLRSGFFGLVGMVRFKPIYMQHAGGMLLPPVQKLVATFIFALWAKMQIESLISFPHTAPYGVVFLFCCFFSIALIRSVFRLITE